MLCGQAPSTARSFGRERQTASPKFEVFEGTTGGTEQHLLHVRRQRRRGQRSGCAALCVDPLSGHVLLAKELNGPRRWVRSAVGRASSMWKCSTALMTFWSSSAAASTRSISSARSATMTTDYDMAIAVSNQFWFGISADVDGQAATAVASETDGDHARRAIGRATRRRSAPWVVYNATEIGRGTNVSGFGGGVTGSSRDEARPRMFTTRSSQTSRKVSARSGRDPVLHRGVRTRNRSSARARTPRNSFSSLLRTGGPDEHAPERAARRRELTNNAGLNPRPHGRPVVDRVSGHHRHRRRPLSRRRTERYWADGWTTLAKLEFLSRTAPCATDRPTISSTSAAAR